MIKQMMSVKIYRIFKEFIITWIPDYAKMLNENILKMVSIGNFNHVETDELCISKLRLVASEW